MRRVRNRGIARVGGLLAFGLLVISARADQAPVVRFAAPRLTLWAERTQAVPFEVSTNFTEELPALAARSSQPDIVEIVRAPEVHPGTPGFLRVRAHRPGLAKLRVGEAEVEVEVRTPQPATDATALPRFIGLTPGSAVWGRFAVGLEWLDEAADERIASPRVVLRLPNGQQLTPSAVSPRSEGPVRRARFELDAAALPAGPNVLASVVGAVTGSAVEILVLHPAADRIRLGECEDTANARRPERLKSAKPTVVVNDAKASGLKAVSNSSPDPVWTLPLEVSTSGYYQLALVVRGTAAGGALPSVGVYVDEENMPRSSARLTSTDWHRLIVGRPIRLEAGARLLSVRFENDFFAGKGSDRNLWLDRYELVRVVAGRASTPAVSTPAGETPMLTMTAPSPTENGATADATVAPMDPDERAAGEFIAREEAALAELGGGLQVALLVPEAPRTVEQDEIIRIEGWLRGEGAKDNASTQLRVNGRIVANAKGQRPKFALAASALTPGENRLELEATDGGAMRARSAAQTLVRAAQLRPAQSAVRITYPGAAQTLVTAEGVCARAEGLPALVAAAELLLDGEPFGPRLSEPDAAQPLFFPLPLQSLSAGPHQLRVRLVLTAREKEKPETLESEAVSIVVQPAPDAAKRPAGRFERALRLLDRFAYGAEPRELARLLEQGEERWLRERLAEAFEPARSSAWQAALSLFPPKRQDDSATVPRALTAMLLEPNPVRLRFTLWAENHFSTWIQKAGSRAKWAEHTTFARLGVAPFADLLFASATSPAMLHYLDQQKSLAGKANENYARELLELHTVGVHGGYTQTDVTRLAALLTGWMTADEALADPARGPALERAFRFDPTLNDGAEQRVFGVSYEAAGPGARFDRVRFALEVLAAHPATARFICRKLAAHYVTPEPSGELVEALAQVYLSQGGDLQAVLRALPQQPEFWSAPPRLTTPLDYALRLARVSGNQNPGAVNDFLRRSGMGLFDRPSPDGYPESDLAYADTQALSQRWRFAQSFALPAFERGDETPVTPRDPAVRQAEYESILQLAAVRLTGRALTGPSLIAARELFAPKPGQRRAQLIREAAQVVAQLPEVQLR